MDNSASAALPQTPDNWPPPSLQRVLQGLSHRHYGNRKFVNREEILRAVADATEWHIDDLLRQFGQRLRHVVQAEEPSRLDEYGALILRLDAYVLSPDELKTALRAAYDAGRDDAGPSSSSALLAVLREQINTQQLLPPFEP